ncbi:hypothetical protein [Limnofasciculus baicalensis]|uniref:HEAT repeat domain-containing protein n=1 Tax=Limnofasciculus baicalensis BBK-W-15 TaxID=2699891 RepID=A0AAE3GV07_9CYAN|nr:hypothetical protein [Limnofasciculus baicalensis]MCP2731195.1 hypothetical protein [Limnofasciculus baicalensis BBK-W-15]
MIKYDLNYYYRLHDVPEETQRVRDIRTQAVAAIATTWHDQPDTLHFIKQFIASDNDGYMRSIAVQEIARGWHDESDTLPLLKQLITSDDNVE